MEDINQFLMEVSDTDLSIQNINISRNPIKRKSRSYTIESDLSDWTDASSLVSIE